MLTESADAPKGNGWIGCVVAIVVVILLAVIAIPGLLSSGRASNERNAMASIRTLCFAEADFRGNDRDGNGVNDYWTADVKGLYTMTSASVPGARIEDTTDQPVKLIELSVACADVDGALVTAGGENHPLSLMALPFPKAGYWYAAMNRDLTVSNPAQSVYRQDTGGTPGMGACHNLSRFGFVAFPDTRPAGKYVVLINENNTCFRSAVTSAIRSGTTVPPGVNGFSGVYRDWPDRNTFERYWNKTD
jgi:type II secretory pathway pseudopilin PulG